MEAILTENQLEYFNAKFSNNWKKKKILNARKHQFKIFDKLNNQIVDVREGRTIKLSSGKELIDFASCSYLGLDTDKRVIRAARNNLEHQGVNFPVARTRLRMENLVKLETCLSEIFCKAAVTTFTSLHVAHLGFIPLLSSGEMPSFSIKENGPLFIMDKVAHACLQIQRGLMEQFGEVIVTDFNDIQKTTDFFKKAFKENRTPISLSDSVISMGGVAPIKELLDCAEKCEGYVYLDDAHGTSIYGNNGCGYVLDLLEGNLHPRLIFTPSLSKGFGTNGGVLALPTIKDIDFVKRFAEPYLFSNPLANAIVNSSLESAKIHKTDELKKLQNNLWKNVKLFDSLIDKNTINISSKTPIRGVFVGDENKTIDAGIKLFDKGFFVNAAMFPTVALKKGILRIALSSIHKEKDIIELCNYINSII